MNCLGYRTCKYWEFLHLFLRFYCWLHFIADYIIQHGTSFCSILVSRTCSQFLAYAQPGTRVTKWEEEEVSKHCSAIIKTLGFYQCYFSQKSRAPFRLLQKMLISSQPDAVHFLVLSGRAVTFLFLESSSSRQCSSSNPSQKCASSWQPKVKFNEHHFSLATASHRCLASKQCTRVHSELSLMWW